jgi:hypothetical protein
MGGIDHAEISIADFRILKRGPTLFEKQSRRPLSINRI